MDETNGKLKGKYYKMLSTKKLHTHNTDGPYLWNFFCIVSDSDVHWGSTRCLENDDIDTINCNDLDKVPKK